MRDYYLHLYDTSGRQVTHGALRISAGDDFEAVAKTAVHGPSDVYSAFLIDGLRIVAQSPSQKGDRVKAPLIDSR